ncbi:MAG: hypothetical protein LC135_01825 [Phycisphaerae bacterium]|nr:hypothetical protein [Phycisphaerae bacterium]MCZ2398592.1 hypothetical protein [Phycisphaerae bacterium]
MATLQQYEQARLNKRRVAARGQLRAYCRKDLSEALGVKLFKHGELARLLQRCRAASRPAPVRQTAPGCTRMHQDASDCTRMHQRERPHPTEPRWTIVEA